MSIERKNIIVKAVIIFIIIFMSLLNGHLQLNRKVSQIEDIFVNGENNDNLSIKYDLQKIDDSMSYFLSLCKSNHYTSDDVTKVDKLHKGFEKNEDIEDYSKWYKEMKEVYPIAISGVRMIELNSEHEKMLNKYEATYNSAIHTIAYSPYNQYVEEYKKETSGMLAKFIINITRVKKVTTFD